MIEYGNYSVVFWSRNFLALFIDINVCDNSIESCVKMIGWFVFTLEAYLKS